MSTPASKTIKWASLVVLAILVSGALMAARSIFQWGEREHATVVDAHQHCPIGERLPCEPSNGEDDRDGGAQTRERDALERACRDDDRTACATLGDLLLEQEPARAEELLRDTCATETIDVAAGEACYRLAVFLETSAAGEQAGGNPSEIVELYRRACSARHAESCFLASLAADREREVGLASEWLSLACDGGVARACVELAARLEEGIPIRQDQRAAVLYRRACAADVGVACFLLAEMIASDKGVPRDDAAAALSYARACELEPDTRAYSAVYSPLVPFDQDAEKRDRACDKLGSYLGDGVDLGVDNQLATAALIGACARATHGACLDLVELVIEDRPPAPAADTVVTATTQACVWSVDEGCLALGELFLRWPLAGFAPQATISALEANCDEEGYVCDELARMYQEGAGVLRDEERADELARQYCEGNEYRFVNGDIECLGEYGSGRGGMRGRRASPPQVIVIGEAISPHDLTEPIIERLYRYQEGRLQLCLEAERERDPGARGAIWLRFEISAKGEIESPSAPSSTLSEEVTDCVLAQLQTFVFPPVRLSGWHVRRRLKLGDP